MVANDDAVGDGNATAAHAGNQAKKEELTHRGSAAAEDSTAAEQPCCEHTRPASTKDVGEPAVERRELRMTGRGQRTSARGSEAACHTRTQQTESRYDVPIQPDKRISLKAEPIVEIKAARATRRRGRLERQPTRRRAEAVSAPLWMAGIITYWRRSCHPVAARRISVGLRSREGGGEPSDRRFGRRQRAGGHAGDNSRGTR